MNEQEDLYTKFYKEAKGLHHRDVLDRIYAMLKTESYIKLEEERNKLINSLSKTPYE